MRLSELEESDLLFPQTESAIVHTGEPRRHRETRRCCPTKTDHAEREDFSLRGMATSRRRPLLRGSAGLRDVGMYPYTMSTSARKLGAAAFCK